jgi:hypothetical protein
VNQDEIANQGEAEIANQDEIANLGASAVVAAAAAEARSESSEPAASADLADLKNNLGCIASTSFFEGLSHARAASRPMTRAMFELLKKSIDLALSLELVDLSNAGQHEKGTLHYALFNEIVGETLFFDVAAATATATAPLGVSGACPAHPSSKTTSLCVTNVFLNFF